jgi:hypothetical protein
MKRLVVRDDKQIIEDIPAEARHVVVPEPKVPPPEDVVARLAALEAKVQGVEREVAYVRRATPAAPTPEPPTPEPPTPEPPTPEPPTPEPPTPEPPTPEPPKGQFTGRKR